MTDINSVSLSGSLKADPELYEAEARKPLCRFYLLVSEVNHKSAGAFKVVVFGASAKGWCKRLHKGERVALVGSLQPRQRGEVEIWARTIIPLQTSQEEAA